MRGARLALLTVAGGAALTLPAAGTAAATTPPDSPPVSGAPATSVPAGASGPTVPGSAVAGEAATTATTIVIPPDSTLPRAGAAVGDLDRRSDDETWSVRRLATATLLGIAALAISGYVYGRLQSVTPRVGRAIARPLR
jgi:hypothetical protein